DKAPAIPNYLPSDLNTRRRIAPSDDFVADDTNEAVLADRAASWKIERPRTVLARGQLFERLAVACAEDATGRVPPGHRKRAAADARVECRDPDRVGLAGARESLAHGEILFALELGRRIREPCDRVGRPRGDLRQL